MDRHQLVECEFRWLCFHLLVHLILLRILFFLVVDELLRLSILQPFWFGLDQSELEDAKIRFGPMRRSLSRIYLGIVNLFDCTHDDQTSFFKNSISFPIWILLLQFVNTNIVETSKHCMVTLITCWVMSKADGPSSGRLENVRLKVEWPFTTVHFESFRPPSFSQLSLTLTS